MKKTTSLTFVFALIGVALPTAAHAITPLLSATVGTGANTAYFVLDFGQSSNSYAFAYQYDGVKTGGNLIDALAGANVGFADAATAFPPNGRFFTTFSYGGDTATPTGNGFWDYWTSSNGVNWAEAAVGADSYSLTNGGYTSFDVNPDFNNLSPTPPRTPIAAPEAGTATLLAVGTGSIAVSLARRRRIR